MMQNIADFGVLVDPFLSRDTNGGDSPASLPHDDSRGGRKHVTKSFIGGFDFPIWGLGGGNRSGGIP
jgi:hypothetical protein